MIRLAKPESFVFLSPSKSDVSTPNVATSSAMTSKLGGEAECRRVRSPDHGAASGILQKPITGIGFPVSLSINHDCL